MNARIFYGILASWIILEAISFLRGLYFVIFGDLSARDAKESSCRFG